MHAQTQIEATAPVQRELPIGTRLRSFALAQLIHAEAQLDRGDSADARHAGVHQARKAIRRTRAALALAGDALGRRAAAVDAALGRLCRGLSPLRDAQALVEALARLEANAPQPLRVALPEFDAAARARRDTMLTGALARDPDFARRRARLTALRAAVASLPWAHLDHATVAAALARSERRTDKATRRAAKRPDDHDTWHRYRRRLRRLRQQDTLLADIAAGLSAQAPDLEARATALGEAQDDALLLRHCGRHSPFAPPARRALRQVARERLAHARTV